jgi:hypothetical protein
MDEILPEDIARFNAHAKFQFRIEALRAASRIKAALISNPNVELDNESVFRVSTIKLAEQFAKWLETGER